MQINVVGKNIESDKESLTLIPHELEQFIKHPWASKLSLEIWR